MKKSVYAAFVLAAFTMTSCDSAEEVTENNEEDAAVETVQYELTETTPLNWIGRWVVPTEDGGTMEAKNHTGHVAISNGMLTVEGDDVTGSFTIDMSTITVTDLDGDKKEGLENHLKGMREGSEDHFFRINEFANVDVKITEIKDGMAHLVLSVLGVELEQKVAVHAHAEGENMKLHGNFTFDFSALNMPMTTPDPEKPEEGNVSPEIEFDLDVTLKKA